VKLLKTTSQWRSSNKEIVCKKDFNKEYILEEDVKLM